MGVGLALQAAGRTEASPATLIIVGATFTIIGLAGLWAKSRGVNLAGTIAIACCTLMGLAVLLLGLVGALATR